MVAYECLVTIFGCDVSEGEYKLLTLPGRSWCVKPYRKSQENAPTLKKWVGWDLLWVGCSGEV